MASAVSTHRIKELFFEHIELWLSGLGVAVVLVTVGVVPALAAIEMNAWKVAAVTALAVGVVHGVLFWVVRRRRERAKAEAKAQLEAQKDRLERRVVEQTGQVRALASALTLAEQRERQAISYVLHDDLQQQLFSVQMQAHFLMADAASQGAEALREQLKAMHEALGEAVGKTRTLAVELNPPVLPEAGLEAALEWMAHQMEEEHGLEVDVRAEAAPVTPSEEMRVLLVRAVRELLFNVVKHANVNRATVRLTRAEPGLIQIEVMDEGVGFCMNCVNDQAVQPAASGFGLYSVRERLGLLGGRLSVDSRPGGGTRVVLQAPLHTDEPPGHLDRSTPDVHANT